MNIVLYDFDRTLTKYDTIFSLGIAIASEKKRPFKTICRFIASLLKLKLRRISNDEFKNRCAMLLLAGESEEKINRIIEKYLSRRLDSLIDTEVYNTIVKNQSRGNGVYIVSSNYDFFVNRFINLWRLSGVVATRAQIVNGIFSGKLLDKSCEGPQKVRRVRELFGDAVAGQAVAYGDSRGDLELLKYVRQGFWVRRGFRGKAKFMDFRSGDLTCSSAGDKR